MARWLREGVPALKPLPFRRTGSALPPAAPEQRGALFTRCGVWGGAVSHRDQQAFWNPSTPHPSSKEEGLAR